MDYRGRDGAVIRPILIKLRFLIRSLPYPEAAFPVRSVRPCRSVHTSVGPSPSGSLFQVPCLCLCLFGRNRVPVPATTPPLFFFLFSLSFWHPFYLRPPHLDTPPDGVFCSRARGGGLGSVTARRVLKPCCSGSGGGGGGDFGGVC